MGRRASQVLGWGILYFGQLPYASPYGLRSWWILGRLTGLVANPSVFIAWLRPSLMVNTLAFAIRLRPRLCPLGFTLGALLGLSWCLADFDGFGRSAEGSRDIPPTVIVLMCDLWSSMTDCCCCWSGNYCCWFLMDCICSKASARHLWIGESTKILVLQPAPLNIHISAASMVPVSTYVWLGTITDVNFCGSVNIQGYISTYETREWRHREETAKE